MKENTDKIKEVRTFTFPNAIVRVSRPELTDEEYERRHKELERAAAVYMREVLRTREEAAMG